MGEMFEFDASAAARMLAAQRPTTERVCARCGAAFVGRGRAMYCSVRCRNATSDAARRARGGLSQREIARARNGARKWYESGGRTERWAEIAHQLMFTRLGRWGLAWAVAWDAEMERIEQESALLPGLTFAEAGAMVDAIAQRIAEWQAADERR